DFSVDLRPQFAPMIDRPFEAEGLRALDRSVEGDPCHHLGIGEMPAPSPHLPNALVFHGPYLFEVGHKNVLKIPGLGEVLKTADACLMHRVEDFAETVELELIGGRVADAHRL